MSYLLDMEPVIYLSRQGGADPIAFFVYGGTQKGLRWAKHEKHGHLREEKQTTGNTMIRLKVREQHEVHRGTLYNLLCSGSENRADLRTLRRLNRIGMHKDQVHQ